MPTETNGWPTTPAARKAVEDQLARLIAGQARVETKLETVIGRQDGLEAKMDALAAKQLADREADRPALEFASEQRSRSAGRVKSIWLVMLAAIGPAAGALAVWWMDWLRALWAHTKP